ncbi:LOW QUALITY PROTEIN: rRNA-processing protein UTP23 homolog [Limulus polyphemus]|uniref:LOW QUALITY PROTEIN: rRNA-processing protein UTP23 homolog n=1 Tax=Limulus polyphemus TaxID=6850 RepID=A0ABM1SIW9_LIMPO|nr:LOW QUALITY PROTEIN: rRNA-processing protein UTP23 homolog [Limulus polyphemus]
MKIKRQKRLHRNKNFYKNSFGFREPYQVLLDATFCQSALKYKVNIKEQLPNYLEGEVKLMTTSCVVTETEKLGPALFGAMLVVKQFHVRKCGHEKKPIEASECLYSMVKNNNTAHYFIATQDPELSEKIRNVSGTPLLYMKFNAIILEKPSDISIKTAEANTSKIKSFELSKFSFRRTKKKSGLGEQEERKATIRRKKVSGPNPLSCKKKKKKTKPNAINKTKVNQKKRKRKRVKVAKHVKCLLSTVSQ